MTTAPPVRGDDEPMVLIDAWPGVKAAEPLPPCAATPGRPARPARVPLLFLLADTGGGHRSAAQAVSGALEEAYPGRFRPVLCDPLAGPGSSWLLRRVTSLYGPVIRLAPWAWGAVYYACDARWVMRLLQRTLLALADGPVAGAVAAHEPAVIVSFHPLTGGAAVRASRRQSRDVPVVTVVTDLVTSHAAWRSGQPDRMAVPSAAALRCCRLDGLAADRCVETGLPVTVGFGGCPLAPGERAALRRSMGMNERRFLAVLTGGGEGSGGMARRAAAIVRSSDDIDTALHLMDRQPERARSALTTINDVSRQALVELRSVLGVLRDAGETAPRAPSSGLSRLGDLADSAAAAGLAVHIEQAERLVPTPPGP